MPDVDPTVGEMLLASLHGNPTRGMSEVILGLIQAAPAELATEIIDAAFELVLCAKKGDLLWLEDSGQAILIGARRALHKDGMRFGQAFWPYKTLFVGPPMFHVIRMPDGPRLIWMACEGLEGAVVRQSEAIAIGNAAVEHFGGRIIEDRQGPAVMQNSFIEQNMTTRAKRRAAAYKQAENMMTSAQHRDKHLKPLHHQRAVIIEAWPGALNVGDRLVSENPAKADTWMEGTVFIVERRLNQDYVIAVAESEDTPVIAPTSWRREDGKPPVDMRGVAAVECGFTDEPTMAQEKTDEREHQPAHAESDPSAGRQGDHEPPEPQGRASDSPEPVAVESTDSESRSDADCED